MRKIKIICPLLFPCLLTAVSVLAAGHGEEGSKSAAAWMDFMWRVINIALFIGVIYYFVGGKAKEFFAGRKQQIADELKDLEDRKAKAEAKLKEVEKSIADIDQKKQEILDQAREQGESTREAIIAKAHEDAEKIKKQAQAKATQERQQMIQALRGEMADQIVKSAENKILEKLGKKEQESLIDEYLTKVVVN